MTDRRTSKPRPNLQRGAGNQLMIPVILDLAMKARTGDLADPADRQNPLACPVRANLRGLPPVFLAIPRCDINSEQNFQMADLLKAAGVPVEIEVYEGATHSFLEAMSISAVASRALDDMAAWIARTLAVSPQSVA